MFVLARGICLILATLIAIGVFGLPSNGVGHQLESKKKSLEQLEINQRQIMSRLYEINKTIKKMADKRSKLSDKMLSAKKNVQDLAAQVNQLESMIKTQRRQLSLRLRTIYKSQKQSFLQIIFGSASPIELDKSLKFMKLVSERDYKIIKTYETNLKVLEKKRDRLKGNVKKLILAKSELKNQEKHLESTQKSKSQLLGELRKKQIAEVKGLKKLRKKSLKLLKGEIASEILRATIFEKKGYLDPPLEHSPTQGFGLIRNRKYRYSLNHKGLFYGRPLGTPIKSIYSGAIAFIGEVQGYGTSVIIDHGDHYYSVYGQVEQINKKIGDRVKEGEIFAKTGFGQRGFGSGLYFELRHFSDAINPEEWFVNDEHRQAKLEETSNENIKE